MKQTVNIYTFREAFNRMGRGSQFSYEGLELLFDYLESFEDDGSGEYELDVVGFCCDFAEDTAETIAINYSVDLTGLLHDPDAVYACVIDYLSDSGALVGATDDKMIVYRQH